MKNRNGEQGTENSQRRRFLRSLFPFPVLHSSFSRRVVGVIARGETLYRAKAVVLTTGTFLKAVMHTGEAKTGGGRAGEGAAESLSDSLAGLRLSSRPLQDRHPVSSQRSHHRLLEVRTATRRRRTSAV